MNDSLIRREEELDRLLNIAPASSSVSPAEVQPGSSEHTAEKPARRGIELEDDPKLHSFSVRPTHVTH